MRRGVGYCENGECRDYLKGVFLLNHSDRFWCPACRHNGFVEAEIEIYHDTHNGVYKTVKIEFDFNASSKRYTKMALLDVDFMTGGGEYILRSPTISTERHAIKVGEQILHYLNNGQKSPRDHYPQPTCISFDLPREEFAKQLEELDLEFKLRERKLNALSV